MNLVDAHSHECPTCNVVFTCRCEQIASIKRCNACAATAAAECHAQRTPEERMRDRRAAIESFRSVVARAERCRDEYVRIEHPLAAAVVEALEELVPTARKETPIVHMTPDAKIQQLRLQIDAFEFVYGFDTASMLVRVREGRLDETESISRWLYADRVLQLMLRTHAGGKADERSK